MASIAAKKGGRVYGRYYLMSPEEVSALAHRRRAQLISDALTLTLILVLTFIPTLILTLILTLVAGRSAPGKPERQTLTPPRLVFPLVLHWVGRWWTDHVEGILESVRRKEK